MFTHEKLRAYKSLDAYNYVVCGHVQMVLYSDIGDDFCVLKAEVLPSMTQVHDIYKTINLHYRLVYRKLFMRSRLSSLS